MNVDKLLAPLACCALALAAGAAPDDVRATSAITWGSTSGGLQCGLESVSNAHATPGGDFIPHVRLFIRNGGSSTLAFYDDSVSALAAAFIVRDQNQSILPNSFEPEFQNYQSYNGTKPMSTLAPGDTISPQFFSLHLTGKQRFSVSFKGTLSTIGGAATPPLECGPLLFGG